MRVQNRETKEKLTGLFKFCSSKDAAFFRPCTFNWRVKRQNALFAGGPKILKSVFPFFFFLNLLPLAKEGGYVTTTTMLTKKSQICIFNAKSTVSFAHFARVFFLSFLYISKPFSSNQRRVLQLCERR